MEANKQQYTVNRTLECLRGAGIPARIKPGRPPAGLPPGAALWLLGDQEILAYPRKLKDAIGAIEGHLAEIPHLWTEEHVPRRTARRWIEGGHAFADTIGNAHIVLPGFVVQVLGNEPALAPPKATEERQTREWRGATLRVIFHLLCDPALAERTIRELAEITGVAPGTIVNALDDLEQNGHLVRLGRRKRRFIPDGELHDRWIREYGMKLRPALFRGRFRVDDPLWHRGFDPVRHGARWGAEPAAAVLGADLRPAVWTLYTTAHPGALLKAAGLRADPAGQVELRQAFWAEELGTPRQDTTPALLVIADLLATRDGRCHAAATDIRTRYVPGS